MSANERPIPAVVDLCSIRARIPAVGSSVLLHHGLEVVNQRFFDYAGLPQVRLSRSITSQP